MTSTDVYAGSVYEMRVLRAIRRIIRTTALHAEELRESNDLTPAQLIILQALADHDGIAIEDLGQAVDLGAETTSGIVGRLVARSLVRLYSDDMYSNVELVALTTGGWALVQQAPRPLQGRLLQGLRTLPESELAILAIGLERLVELMGANHVDAAAILELEPWLNRSVIQ